MMLLKRRGAVEGSGSGGLDSYGEWHGLLVMGDLCLNQSRARELWLSAAEVCVKDGDAGGVLQVASRFERLGDAGNAADLLLKAAAIRAGDGNWNSVVSLGFRLKRLEDLDSARRLWSHAAEESGRGGKWHILEFAGSAFMRLGESSAGVRDDISTGERFLLKAAEGYSGRKMRADDSHALSIYKRFGVRYLDRIDALEARNRR